MFFRRCARSGGCPWIKLCARASLGTVTEHAVAYKSWGLSVGLPVLQTSRHVLPEIFYFSANVTCSLLENESQELLTSEALVIVKVKSYDNAGERVAFTFERLTFWFNDIFMTFVLLREKKECFASFTRLCITSIEITIFYIIKLKW